MTAVLPMVKLRALAGSFALVAVLLVGVACAQELPSAAGSSDRATLMALYDATDGSNWANNTNWLSDRPLGEWHGITTDANGRVEVAKMGRAEQEPNEDALSIPGRILRPADTVEIEDTDDVQILSLKDGDVTCYTRVFLVGEVGRREITRQASQDEISELRASGVAP